MSLGGDCKGLGLCFVLCFCQASWQGHLWLSVVKLLGGRVPFFVEPCRQAARWHGAVAVVLIGGDCLGLGPSFVWGLEQALFCRQAAWRLGKLMIAGSVLVVGAVPSSCLVAGFIVIEWRSQNQGCVWQ